MTDVICGCCFRYEPCACDERCVEADTCQAYPPPTSFPEHDRRTIADRDGAS